MPTRTTAPAAATFAAEPNPGSVRRELRQHLLDLNFHAFCRCLCLLLTELGYEDARPAGRVDWKGRNRGGGYDIEAWLPGGFARRKVVAVAKQFDDQPVYQRMVDELRGAALRSGAAEAVLITTGAFSPVALLGQAGQQGREQGDSSIVVPARLIDGEELLDLLLAHGIGVREEPAGAAKRARLRLDEDLFDGLSRACPGNGRCRQNTGANNGLQYPWGRPSWRVTVQVGPMGQVGQVGPAGSVSPDCERVSQSSCGGDTDCGGGHRPSKQGKRVPR
jgi:hypothetical protein